jgi:acylglycerol lipase
VQAYPSPVDEFSGEIPLQGNRRYHHRWTPEAIKPWATLTIVHGFGDHGGRFAGMGTSLASLGILVQVFDLVGHGRSPGRQGCIESYDQLLDEVEASMEHATSLAPKSPHFLFGQSMGGNLVLNLALRRPDSLAQVRGVIAGSPMIQAGKMPKQQIMDAGRWLAGKIPNLRIKAPVEVAKLSTDRRAQDAYLMDPWVHRSMSLRLAANLIDTGLWALENAGQLSIPTLVTHGLEDTLTCPKASRKFAEQSNGMAQFKGWAGCRHDLHDELQRERYFAYLTSWMKQQCISSFTIAKSLTSAVAKAS